MKLTEQVENILKASYKARNSDKELIIIYMQKAGMKLTEKQVEIFKNMPSVESIRRIRQALQEQGKYLASPKIEAERYEKYKEMREDPSSVESIVEAGSAAFPTKSDEIVVAGRRVLPWEQS